MKTLEDEWYAVIKLYKFNVFEVLRDFCVIIYSVSALSLCIVSTSRLYDMQSIMYCHVIAIMPVIFA